MDKLNIFGYEVSSRPISELVEIALGSSPTTVVNTINPHSYVESKRDSHFSEALKKSDYLIPDGSGISLAARFIHSIELKKIAGTDLFLEAMKQLEASQGSVFFLGSSDEVLAKIKERLNVQFPSVTVHVLSPPFKPEFSQSDLDKFEKRINDTNPDVVFVGLTAPKQEKLIHKIKQNINPKLISGIGAVFDFYAGTIKRPNEFWIKLHLEWLGRLCSEPRRLWTRNFVSTPIFLKDMLIYKVHRKKF